MNSYDKNFLSDSMKTLAEMINYALVDYNCDADLFFRMFIESGIASFFEQGHPSYISGKSGAEVVWEIFENVGLDAEHKKPRSNPPQKAEYWSGWVLAYYQWKSGRTFKEISSSLPLSKIIEMYPLFHEMDLERFCEMADENTGSGLAPTNLQLYRHMANLSQRELAQISNVHLRNIQMYEQRQNDINKAQGVTLLALARALHCNIENILES